jgi:hypothetical protein
MRKVKHTHTHSFLQNILNFKVHLLYQLRNFIRISKCLSLQGFRKNRIQLLALTTGGQCNLDSSYLPQTDIMTTLDYI